MNFTEADKEIIRRFLLDIRKFKINGLSTEKALWGLADPETRLLINRILALDPATYGFKGKRLPKEPVPDDAVIIDNLADNAGGEYKLDNNAYLPQKVFAAFSDMANAFSKENPGRQLLIGSGYRSPAYQIVTILYILATVYDFDLNQTLKRVAMPEYSQHCSANNTAIDILNIDGEPDDQYPQKFGESIEYKWLLKNANTYDFKESYPPKNPDGIMWEPWHWQFVG